MEYYLKLPTRASEIERNGRSDKALGLFRHGVVANLPQWPDQGICREVGRPAAPQVGFLYRVGIPI